MTEHPSLFAVLGTITDPRKARGCRHPADALLRALVLSYICGESLVADVQRFISYHWKDLKETLGFTRKRAPHRTTYSRFMEKLDPKIFAAAITHWLAALIDGELTVAIDGKASKQAKPGEQQKERPLMMLNAFEVKAKVLLRQWLVEPEKSELSTLRDCLEELFAAYPAISVLTLDAAYADRTLLGQIVDAKRRYLVRIKEISPRFFRPVKQALKKNYLRRRWQPASKKGGQRRFVSTVGGRRNRSLHPPASECSRCHHGDTN